MICGLWAQEGGRGGIEMGRRCGVWVRRLGGGGLGSVVVGSMCLRRSEGGGDEMDRRRRGLEVQV